MPVPVACLHADASTIMSWLGDDAAPAADPCAADLVIIGAADANPVRTAQALRGEGCDGLIVMLTRPEGKAALQAAVQVAPFLGQDVTILEDGAGTERAVQAQLRTSRQRKRAQAMQSFAQAALGDALALRRERVLLGSLLQHAPMGVAMVDAEQHVVGWNQAAQTITGRSERTVLGQPITEAMGIDELPEAAGLCPAPDRGGNQYLEFTSARIRLPGGDGRLLLFQDVTSRVQAERALQQTLDSLEDRVRERTRALEISEGKYRSLVETSHDLIWSTDAKGRFTFVNQQAAMRIYGRDAEALIGAPMWAMALPAHQAGDQAFIEEVLAGDGPITHETVHVGADDKVMLRWTGAPLQEDGRRVGATGTAADVTQRHHAERHRRLAQEQAAQIEKMRDMAAFRAAFINSAAHELRTPLTPIILQLEMMRLDGMDPWTPAQRDAFSVVDRNVGRFARLVQDLLDSSRIEGGRLSMDRVPLDLVSWLARVVQDYRAQSHDRNIHLSTPERPVVVQADAGRMTQVLQNILNNAMRFTGPGGQITCSLRCDAHDAILSIEDDGEGMTAAHLDKAFQPFQQLHPENKAQGAGLGLYLAKLLVELHDGRIACTSAGPGKGSCFTIRLPLA